MISKISNAFIDEALSSPNLLADMAAMEKYMAESYSGRVFIELLQNADDCKSSKIVIKEINGNIFFANNGRPFDENDVIAICRSGASNKKRGDTIGYRGVGFKSTTYLTDEILIYSDKTYFTFSKKHCSEKLSTPIDKIPMIRIPLLVDSVEYSIQKEIASLEQQGYTTIFVFKNAKVAEFLEELQQIESSMFIFLKNILECSIKIKPLSKSFLLQRTPYNDGTLVRFIDNQDGAWYILSHQHTQIAFKYDLENKKIICCEDNEQLYHSYLPTFDKMLFPAKVNADFSTDPSRKHITTDEKSELAIANIAENIAFIVNNIFSGKYKSDFSDIFSILSNYIGFSKCNSLLKQQIKTYILDYVSMVLDSKETISIKEYKLLPEWLEESEKLFLRSESIHIRKQSLPKEIYITFKDVDKFMQMYSAQCFTIEDMIEVMTEKSLIENMPKEMQGKILGRIIRTTKFAKLTPQQQKKLDEIRLFTNSGIKSIKELDGAVVIDQAVCEGLTSVASKADINWFSEKRAIDAQSILGESQHETPRIHGIKKEIKPHIPKWRSAEQQCLEIEKYFGNIAIDVSKKNVGYDVESTTPNGKKRYIEVKSVSQDGSFSITNNEYTAAHQYGDEYYLCLLVQNEQSVQVIYVRNPIKNITFEKRIKQWEWFCDTYSGESYIFEN